MAFSHLHVHSHYSLLNALPQLGDLAKAAKADGQPALALTDNGALYGAIEFYQACMKHGVKPIIGIDNYVALRTRHDKESRVDNRRSRLVTLAKDETGWKSLIKLTTAAHFEGFYYKPRIDRELVERHKDGVICIMPFFSGESSQHLKNGNVEAAEETISWYKSVFGDDFYYEVAHHPEIEGGKELRKQVIELCKKTNTKMVAAHDVYYMKQSDRMARKTLMSIQSSFGSGDTPNTDATEDFSFVSQETMQKYFADLPEALANVEEIVDKCNLTIKLAEWKFPRYPIASGKQPDDELHDLAMKGVTWRGLSYGGEVKTRLDYELDVIKMKGYAVYFLVVGDLLREARERGILTTIRGSVAGSLATYVLGITNVNPLEYNLPFERFLNPERPSAPDIDMDYADNRRDEIIDYTRRKYGRDNVAQIGTFGTMMARGSVRDVARALGFPIDLADRISKMIPMGAQGFPMTIARAMDEVPELKQLYQADEDVAAIIDMAKKIEGCARHIGVHAAGVLISPDPLVEYVPLQFDPKSVGDEAGKIITQFDMHGAGEDGVGLLKFDFLGIRNLAILADAVKLVKKIKDIDVDIENIPLDDAKTFEMLGRGETVGLFQLNGSGMTKWLTQLRPSTIHDINAMVALYRPGPMEMIPEYVARKHDPSKVVYLDPRMKTILERSFGVITYQDDVMMVAIELAGYSWLEADKLRKAMGKKIPELMEEQKKKLQEGLLKNGMSAEKSDELWKLIEPFAAYGFNKAHAASYGRVAYQTAYMKANYPAIYMAAVLTAESGDVEEVASIVAECSRMGIKVLPPDINQSFEGFTVVKNDAGADDIRFGLTTIKNFGSGIAHSIIEERDAKGAFASLEDFLHRVTDRNLNKKSLESLVKAGALDRFGDRSQLLGNLDYLLAYNKETAKKPTNQSSLFAAIDGDALPPLRLEPAPQITKEQQLAWEKELLGLFVSGHPLDKHRAVLQKRDTDIKRIRDSLREGHPIVIAGIVEDIRVIRTKKGDEMAFVKIADLSGSIECVVFPKTFETFKKFLIVDKCIAVKANMSRRNGEPSLLIEQIKAL